MLAPMPIRLSSMLPACSWKYRFCSFGRKRCPVTWDWKIISNASMAFSDLYARSDRGLRLLWYDWKLSTWQAFQGCWPPVRIGGWVTTGAPTLGAKPIFPCNKETIYRSARQFLFQNVRTVYGTPVWADIQAMQGRILSQVNYWKVVAKDRSKCWSEEWAGLTMCMLIGTLHIPCMKIWGSIRQRRQRTAAMQTCMPSLYVQDE